MNKLCARLYCGSSLLKTIDLYDDKSKYNQLLNDFGVYYNDGQDVDLEQVLSMLIRYGYNVLTQYSEDMRSAEFRLEFVTIKHNNVITLHDECVIPFYVYTRSMSSYIDKYTHTCLNQWTFELYATRSNDMLAKCIVKERPAYDIIYMKSYYKE